MKMYCTSCGTIDKPKKLIKGSFVVELLMWLMFILPGLIYSCWRVAGAEMVCRKCGKATIIPEDSPIARKALAA
jgi:hypothetical protein